VNPLKMAKTEQFTAQEMIDALTATRGMITLAAQKLDCAPNTVRRYIREYKSVAEAQRTNRDKMTDAVELKLYDKMMSGDTTAIIFYLKTQARDRGYVEKILIEGNIQLELVNQVVKAAEAAGVDASEVFNAIIAELAAVGANSETGN